MTTKADLARAVAMTTDVDGETANRAVDAVLRAMADSFEKGEGIEIRKFGVFRVYKTSERIGRNPKNGDPAFIPSFHRVRFKVSDALKVGAPNGKYSGRPRKIGNQ